MLTDCIRLAQTNNEALEALLQKKIRPLNQKCGRQLHIEDGNEEMILAFIELVKDFLRLIAKYRRWYRSSVYKTVNVSLLFQNI